MNQETQQSTDTTQPIFQIQRLYVKEQSAKAPQAPQIFLQKWEPEFSTELQINHIPLQKNHFEVTLHVTVTAKLKGVTAFVAEAKQAGVFQISGFNEKIQEQLLSAQCPTILLPYARKIISDMTFEAGFPPFTLAPINFDAAYQHQQQEMQKSIAEASLKENEILDVEVH